MTNIFILFVGGDDPIQIFNNIYIYIYIYIYI